jgi:DNA-binding transcriptional regulator YhcF (GntR family)/uncharacterized membrane protein
MNLYFPKSNAVPVPALRVPDANDRTPKFLQLVNTVIAGIEEGVLKPGDRLPSINETSVEYLLARATVEKAYGVLQEMGHVASLQRKGYFVRGQRTARRVMLLVGQLTDTTEQLARELGQVLGAEYRVDVFVHAYKKAYFCETLENQLDRYHGFVILPEHVELGGRVQQTLNKIPQDRLVWLDGPSALTPPLRDILAASPAVFAAYRSVRLVMSDDAYIPAEWLCDLEAHCAGRGIEYYVVDTPDEEDLQARTAYVVFTDQDLVALLKQARAKGWQPGREIGMLSYQDQPYKELLAGGISTFGPDIRQVARQAADQLITGRRQPASLALTLQRRASL